MSVHDKVQPIDELSRLLGDLRSQGRTIVQCHGVFDLLHIGHIRYLQKARRSGDVLVVTVTSDRFVNKGPHRPVFQERLRQESIAALDCVDYVAISDSATAVDSIRQLRPHIFAKGAEFRDQKTPELRDEECAAAEIGAAVEFIDELTSSSSRLINRNLSVFSEETEDYLSEARRRFNIDELLRVVDAFRSLKVVVIGEAIIDEYYSCGTLGQSTEAPIVAMQYESHQQFPGGALNIANYLARFVDNVSLVSMLGEKDSQQHWIQSNLRSNIEASFVHRAATPTIIKRRYRETYFGIPMFEVHFLDDIPLTEQENADLLTLLESLPDFDLVLVADYGHGMLSDSTVQHISDNARFLALTTRASPSNAGFHVVSKYPRADYVTLAERDLLLERRCREGVLHEMLRDVGQQLYAGTISVTLGSRGCLCYNRRNGFDQAPALATRVSDRVGAGDSFFAMTSLCAKIESSVEALALLGNVAGAESVAVVGNVENAEDITFRRYLEHLLK